jgi:octaprenyl-diphosphate synthase
MTLDQLFKDLQNDLQEVEREIERQLQSEVGLITEIGHYICKSGGKRLRPTLLLLSAALSNYHGKRKYVLGSILEFIHTATLLHDDVIDHATLRRGKPSANFMWGNTLPILVGDFLYSKSMLIAVDDGDMDILRVIAELTMRMTEGEVLESIRSRDLTVQRADYLKIIQLKTAYLFSACCQMGAILGKVTRQKEQALKNYGLHVGVAFQISDDTLDFMAPVEKFGKTPGTDLKEGKITLPLIILLEKATKEERAFLDKVIQKSENLREEDFRTVLDLIKKYNAIELSLQEARDYANMARSYLDEFEDSPAKHVLVEITSSVLNREK